MPSAPCGRMLCSVGSFVLRNASKTFFFTVMTNRCDIISFAGIAHRDRYTMLVCMLCYPFCPGGCWRTRAVKQTMTKEERAKCTCGIKAGTLAEHARLVHGMTKSQLTAEHYKLSDERVARVCAVKHSNWKDAQEGYEVDANTEKNKISVPDNEREPDAVRCNVASLAGPSKKMKRTDSWPPSRMAKQAQYHEAQQLASEAAADQARREIEGAECRVQMPPGPV